MPKISIKGLFIINNSVHANNISRKDYNFGCINIKYYKNKSICVWEMKHGSKLSYKCNYIFLLCNFNKVMKIIENITLILKLFHYI